MSTRKAVWFNKRRRMPRWLAEGEAAHRNDTAFRYWLKIWYAQPRWAKKRKVFEIYARATAARRLGLDVHVDHIVPLKSPYVCGLHWEGNLQIITEADNYAKSNHTWPERADCQEQGRLF